MGPLERQDARVLRVTLKDIAREVGLSVTAVSRALNGHKDVSEATRARVLEVARRLNYHPNTIARGLVTQKSRTVGLFSVSFTQSYSMMADPFAAELVDAILERFGETGYDVVLFSRSRIESADSYVALAVQRQIDAAIFLGLRTDDRRYEELRTIGIPLITVDVPIDVEHAVCVGCDQVKGAYMAVSHLIGMGHRRIAYISGHWHAPVSHERCRGYREAMEEAGLAVRDEWILEGDFTRASGQRCMERILSLDPRPTAVFCASDLMALGAMDGARLAGLNVPDDVSIIGYDDIREAAEAQPPLTTVHQPRHLLGKAVADAAIAAMHAKGALAGKNRILLEPALVQRATVAPWREAEYGMTG